MKKFLKKGFPNFFVTNNGGVRIKLKYDASVLHSYTPEEGEKSP